MIATCTEPKQTYSTAIVEVQNETSTKVKHFFFDVLKFETFADYSNHLQKKRGRPSNPKHSIASTDSLVESTTSELGYSKSSSGIGGISEVSDQCNRTISIESVNSMTNDLNGPFIEHVIDVKLVDIDNNNEKLIDNAEPEGLKFIPQFILRSVS